jgi:hypothetical protein
VVYKVSYIRKTFFPGQIHSTISQDFRKGVVCTN